MTPRTLTIKLSELLPVVDAVKLTMGLRGRIVGGKKRSARLVPAEGGMTVELFGSCTFVPIATGALEHELSVDANLLAGFLRNSTRAFHPAEIVGFNIVPDHLIGTCGTLKVTLQLGPSSHRQYSRSTAAQNATDLRALSQNLSTRAEDMDRVHEPQAGPIAKDEGNRNSTLATGQTEKERLWDAETELRRIEEIERTLKSARRERPDYNGLRFLAVGWFLLLAIIELVFGGGALAWLVVLCSIAFIADAWSEFSAKFKWDKMRWEKQNEISEIVKRIELLGYSARLEPSRWQLRPTSKKNASDA